MKLFDLRWAVQKCHFCFLLRAERLWPPCHGTGRDYGKMARVWLAWLGRPVLYPPHQLRLLVSEGGGRAGPLLCSHGQVGASPSTGKNSVNFFSFSTSRNITLNVVKLKFIQHILYFRVRTWIYSSQLQVQLFIVWTVQCLQMIVLQMIYMWLFSLQRVVAGGSEK